MSGTQSLHGWWASGEVLAWLVVTAVAAVAFSDTSSLPNWDAPGIMSNLQVTWARQAHICAIATTAMVGSVFIGAPTIWQFGTSDCPLHVARALQGSLRFIFWHTVC